MRVLEGHSKLQLQSIPLRPVLRGCFVQPLEGDAALREFVANLRPNGKYFAAVPVEVLATVERVVGELLEPIANHAELEPAQ